MGDDRGYLDCGDDYLNCSDDYLNCSDDVVTPVEPPKDNWFIEAVYKAIIFFNSLFKLLKFW